MIGTVSPSVWVKRATNTEWSANGCVLIKCVPPAATVSRRARHIHTLCVFVCNGKQQCARHLSCQCCWLRGAHKSFPHKQFSTRFSGGRIFIAFSMEHAQRECVTVRRNAMRCDSWLEVFNVKKAQTAQFFITMDFYSVVQTFWKLFTFWHLTRHMKSIYFIFDNKTAHFCMKTLQFHFRNLAKVDFVYSNFH